MSHAKNLDVSQRYLVNYCEHEGMRNLFDQGPRKHFYLRAHLVEGLGHIYVVQQLSVLKNTSFLAYLLFVF